MPTPDRFRDLDPVEDERRPAEGEESGAEGLGRPYEASARLPRRRSEFDFGTNPWHN